MKKLKYILSIGLIVSLLSCGGGEDPILPPSASALIFPVNNESCNTGVSVNTEQSKVIFKWNAALNTTSYTVVIKSLVSNIETQRNTPLNQIEITITKNTPYKWWVLSKSDETVETAKSDEWKFYNSGDAVKTHAPFPAELVTPVMGSSTSESTVTLEWVGSDVDNDIKEYEVYFGTVNPPVDKEETTQASKVENVSIESNSVYYWKVVTTDNEGNTSSSQVFQFKTED